MWAELESPAGPFRHLVSVAVVAVSAGPFGLPRRHRLRGLSVADAEAEGEGLVV
jgi:hypothetical protein